MHTRRLILFMIKENNCYLLAVLCVLTLIKVNNINRLFIIKTTFVLFVCILLQNLSVSLMKL